MSLKPLFAGVAFLAACGSSNTSKTSVQEAAATPPPPRALRYDTVLSGTPQNLLVEIGDMVADKCDIPAGKAYFNYASDALDAQDRTILIMVADCMKTGPLAGDKIIVTGFADYRGEYDQNAQLGLERSKTVADELVKHGVAADRIFVRTYGERGASYPVGIDGDRKVELRLVHQDEKAL